MVESLQDDLAEERSRRRQAECNYDHAVADREKLRAQLTESQRRERAAIEDLRDNADRPCRVCKKWADGKCTLPPPKDCAGFFRWEWRGPVAGEGAV